MLTFSTSVIERRLEIRAAHATHPFEAGWAGEAVFFVQLEGTHPELTVQAQISPDGLHWVDRGVPSVMSAEDEIAAIDLVNFGGWLRLVITGATEEQPAKVLVHLALKG
ncbi:DUF6385 domain-containing protein [Actinophytocola gossypii]|uniref:DUF6385 domain-containing protein n=1 Tax=Actinophytocola gossypii TaxID=2812003 RepID=A0ABT2JAT1_9PSEU|nr:DUF6385 domain-containing protein [Actinophytocola gossypii]MCT2584868.1 hypothetical protein [Actinophytocola gossypii]